MPEKMAFNFAAFNRYGAVFFSTGTGATDALNKARKEKLEIDGTRLEVKGGVTMTLWGQPSKR